MKIMTLNLMTDSLDLLEKVPFSTRSKAILKMIHQYDPDLIGVQELTENMFSYLQQLQKDYVFFGDSRHSMYNNEYTSILYKKDKFEQIDGSTSWLSPHPDKPGSRFLLSQFPRIVTQAHLKEKETGKILTFANTHLDANLPYMRTRQAKVLLSLLPEEHVILTGDFNTVSDSPALQILQKRLKDAVSDDMGSTLCGRFGSLSHRYHPIDHIFYTNDILVSETQKIKDTYDGVMPSDHYPVIMYACIL